MDNIENDGSSFFYVMIKFAFLCSAEKGMVAFFFTCCRWNVTYFDYTANSVTERYSQGVCCVLCSAFYLLDLLSIGLLSEGPMSPINACTNIHAYTICY